MKSGRTEERFEERFEIQAIADDITIYLVLLDEPSEGSFLTKYEKMAEWEEKEEGKEVTQQWEDDWDDDDVNDDFSLQLRRELENNTDKK
ncbi:hypothetical protein RJ639_017155 [Escallonia herrerae]|uniref:26S proteasome complex subunit SEM1 n=1 Tax=Escallonia herrerae TaxID=1293975 RepID=A0AA88VBG3_9ASTE|nr:hypothetical protein RJ639_017155 [Escallonia herrerae]